MLLLVFMSDAFEEAAAEDSKEVDDVFNDLKAEIERAEQFVGAPWPINWDRIKSGVIPILSDIHIITKLCDERGEQYPED